MRFAARAVGVLAADLEHAIEMRDRAERLAMPLGGLARDLAEADALDLRVRAGEVTAHEARLEAHGVKDLRAAIGLIGRDAHLGHDLQQRLVDGLDVALVGFLDIDVDAELGDELLDGLEREVRVDRLGAIAGERRELVDLVGLTRFDDETDRCSEALADQMVVHGRRREQRRDRNAVRAGSRDPRG